MKTIHVRKCGLSYFSLRLNNIVKIWFSLQNFSELGWVHYFKGCTMCSGHKHFCNEISLKPLEVVLLTINHQNVEKKKYWKGSRRNNDNDNDVGAFAMLKKIMFCVFIGHERKKKAVWGQHYFH